MTALPAHRLSRLILALALAAGLQAVPAVVPGAVPVVRAAAPDLTIVTDATYTVQPEQHRVRVNLNLVLTNHLKDTVTKRYYFDQAFLAVLPGTSGYAFSWDGKGTPEVHVSKRTPDYTLLRLDLGQRLFSGKSATYKLRFDLVDPGGEPTRDVRIGETLASFPVWAFATDGTPGSSVKVVFPAGFDVEVEAGEIAAPRMAADGRVVFQTGALDKPLSFFAYLVADRPGAYSERSVQSVVGGEPVELTVRSWPDDPTWSQRIGDLVEQALPELGDELGLAWPRDGGLVVQEAASRSTGGYAGLFDAKVGRVEVAYYADSFVVLHEAAHAWFNGALLADRWANEAFASHYGRVVADRLGIEVQPDVLTPELREAAIPLNAWGPIGRETGATEDYAYAAALEVADAIAERAGPEVLKAVWVDAAARIGAYQPPSVPEDGTSAAVPGAATAAGTATAAAAEPEMVDGPPDWRGLLDLLEAHSGRTFTDIWRTWIARDSDLPLLEARATARSHYDEVVEAAADWPLPRPIRDAMRAWQFQTASDLLDRAGGVIDQRHAIETAATASGLTPPDSLRAAFELSDGFVTASREAAAELEAIERYDAAVATRPAQPDTLQQIGLWGTTPEADLARARDLFASGDLAASTDAAGAAATVWISAEDVGRGRLVSLGALLLAILLALAMVLSWLRGVRRRRRRFAARWVGPDPYATLAATPEPPATAVIGEERRRGADQD
jgi:hypothetical protein